MLGLSRLYNRGCRGPNDMLTEEERLARDVSGWLAATVRNEDAAFSWCQKAADRGLDEAMFLLGYETKNREWKGCIDAQHTDILFYGFIIIAGTMKQV